MLDLIVNAGRTEPDSPTLRGALALARRQQAFLTGLELVTVYPSLLAVPDAIALLAEAEKEARGRRDWWLGLCREAGIAGDWEVIRGIHVEALAKRSRLADFVIGELRISDPDAPAGLDEITRTLFADAAPMLLIPDVWHRELHIERVLIAWNGSAEAAHAVKAALPLLAQASVVHVLDGERAGLPGISPPPLPLRGWLRRHGIEAPWQPFPTEHDVGSALLDAALSFQADLLVMGAWGRSRIGELVLGGATRWLLGHATLPLFLAR
ncbi:universal stress protein [Rhodanobacter ginsengisoli]|uniref:Universal stress protein n=1 Tax=Rhodanobacter ginsengisoli TaxID=418646 RepID=A0ABW0QKH1_9GAMM